MWTWGLGVGANETLGVESTSYQKKLDFGPT